MSQALVKHLRNPRLLLALGAVAVAVVIYLLVQHFGKQESAPKKYVQQITVIQPPPPPPPPPKQEPPPPEVKEEVKVPEPEQPPEPEQANNDPPPSNSLGVDADGGAGGDGFGLAGRKGGHGLTQGRPFAAYESALEADLLAHLNDASALRKSAYSVTVKVWIDRQKHPRVELARSTGNPKLDGLLQRVLGDLAQVSEAPPIEMPQPVFIRIKSNI